MPQLRVRVLLILCALVGLAAPMPATGPAFWTVATTAEFLRGTSDGVFVSLQGVLTPGPTTTSRLASAPPQIWSLAEAPDGTLWAGSGGDGRLIRIRPGQAEETVFDAEESHIFAVALSGARTYAASSPDGRVYVVDGTAAARPFFDPQEKYIWALAVDATGRLWIGAGNPAVIYRVDANGTGSAVYRPPASHVVSLAVDVEGRVLAGTESPGRLYRLGANDRPFVLLDSGLSEVRAAVVQPDGTIYAAAVARGDETPAAGESTSVAVTIAAPPAAGSPAPPARRSVLYRIDVSGAWEPVWETSDVIYDLALARDGAVLAASGPEGRLYRIEPTRDVQLLTGVDARQITRFAGAARGTADLPAFATASPGRVMTPAATPGATATYVSPVRDSKSVATWGLIRWQGAGAVTLFTRSGNTEKPDDSWSEWAGPYARPEGEAIQSPPARFLQWRAVFGRTAAAPSSRLTSVTVAYLPRNSRPVVSTLTTHPPGVVFARPFASEDGAIFGLDDATANARRPPGDPGQPAPSPGRRMYQKGLQTIVWKAEDADGDRLSYRLQYRREGDTAWRDLRSDLIDTIWVWDTTAVADGRYIVRLLVSDDSANPDDRALVAERESDPIEIDNTPPVITTEITRTAAGARLVVRVRDAQSPVQKLEYSIGGGPWQLVYPADGLADALEERFEIPLASEADAARLVVRATDLSQNVSSVPGGR